MALNGLHDVVLDLRRRLNMSNSLLSQVPVTVIGTVSSQAKALNHVYTHRNEYESERVVHVNWVMGANPVPFPAGTVMKILYGPGRMVLADANDLILFVSGMINVDQQFLMERINSSVTRVTFYDGVLKIIVENRFEYHFVRIRPVQLERT
jgi:hypothetical protein